LIGEKIKKNLKDKSQSPARCNTKSPESCTSSCSPAEIAKTGGKHYRGRGEEGQTKQRKQEEAGRSRHLCSFTGAAVTEPVKVRREKGYKGRRNRRLLSFPRRPKSLLIVEKCPLPIRGKHAILVPRAKKRGESRRSVCGELNDIRQKEIVS
jgi:hypothetical protein